MVMFLILLIVILSMAVIFFSARARVEASQAPQPDESRTFESKFPDPSAEAIPVQPSDVKPKVPETRPPTYAKEQQPRTGQSDQKPRQPSIEDLTRTVETLQKKLYLAEQKYKPVLSSPKARETVETVDGKGEEKTDGTLSRPVPRGRGVHEFALGPTSITVRFIPGALDLDADEAQRLAQHFRKQFGEQFARGQRYMITTDYVEGLSESSRMAYYRVTAVRNQLMRVAGVPKSALDPRSRAVQAADLKGTESLEVRIVAIPMTGDEPARVVPAASN